MSSIALLSGLYNRQKTEPRQRIRRLFTILIAVLFIILTAEIAFHFVISPRLRVTKVELIADAGFSLTDAETLKLAGLKGDESFFAVDERGIAARIASYAPVKSVDVEKLFPHTLRIHITQREALALCLVSIEGRSVPVTIDEEGVVFQIGESVSEYDLPVLSGFTFAGVELGQRINSRLLGFFMDLRRLKDSSPAMYSLISELRFVTRERTGFEVVLYPRDYPVAVRIDPRISTDIMRRIILVLDVFANQGMLSTIEEIDFRTDTPSVRFKEE